MNLKMYATCFFSINSTGLVGAEDDFCDLSQNGTNVCQDPAGSTKLYLYKYVLYLAQFLIGIGATPLYTLGTLNVDRASYKYYTCCSCFFVSIVTLEVKFNTSRKSSHY